MQQHFMSAKNRIHNVPNSDILDLQRGFDETLRPLSQCIDCEQAEALTNQNVALAKFLQKHRWRFGKSDQAQLDRLIKG